MEPINSTVPAPISRTQAWCKLACLIADGLPAPRGIDFTIDYPGLNIYAADRDDFDRWTEHFKATSRAPFVSDRRRAFVRAEFTWEGYDAEIRLHYDLPEVKPEPITEDMTRVREVAEHGEDEPRCPDPECGEPLAAIASGAVGHCGRTCVPVDEETVQVEEDAAERRSVEREQRAEVEEERTEGPVLPPGVADYRQPLTEFERRVGVSE